jgi:hypothetical protein
MKTEPMRIPIPLKNHPYLAGTLGVLLTFYSLSQAADTTTTTPWKVGTPIVTYWAGPAMTDAVAQQMADGGWNLVWCGERDLDLVKRHGLRGQLQDPLITPATLETPGQREKLDSLIARVRTHPALYSYFITDEPNATNFPALGKLVAYLRTQDPAHLAYINLFPTYANNEQLGNPGNTTQAYQAHLRQYVDIVKPALVSYDHYQFATNGDTSQYFLNLALIRQASQNAGLPFLNIVQACTWTPSMRVPTAQEMRYLIYTTLAYGAQGISYYVYCCAGHTGGIANADGTPTPLYPALKSLNREFVAISRELQSLNSLGVFHAGMLPPGTEPLPKNAAFVLDPPWPDVEYRAPQPVKGVLLGYFGPAAKAGATSKPTHVLVVNLDYQTEVVAGLRGPARLEIFDANNGQWSRTKEKRAALRLPPGDGRLVRIRR